MDVIEKLTDEKAKINAELMGAVNLVVLEVCKLAAWRAGTG